MSTQKSIFDQFTEAVGVLAEQNKSVVVCANGNNDALVKLLSVLDECAGNAEFIDMCTLRTLIFDLLGEITEGSKAYRQQAQKADMLNALLLTKNPRVRSLITALQKPQSIGSPTPNPGE